MRIGNSSLSRSNLHSRPALKGRESGRSVPEFRTLFHLYSHEPSRIKDQGSIRTDFPEHNFHPSEREGGDEREGVSHPAIIRPANLSLSFSRSFLKISADVQTKWQFLDQSEICSKYRKLAVITPLSERTNREIRDSDGNPLRAFNLVYFYKA